MKTKFPRVLFFDIGGVLLSDGWGHKSRQKAAKKFEYNYEEMEQLHHFIFNIYEIGRITMDEYLDRTIFSKPVKFTREDFKAFLFSQSTELPDTLKWLKKWKTEHPSCPIISINNEGRELNDYRIQKFGLHDCFDAFISSCEVGMRKPDPQIFKLALGVALVKPDESVYFDDRPMHVEAARKLGIQAYHHQDFTSTKKIIENL